MTDHVAALYRMACFLACIVFWLVVVMVAGARAHDVYKDFWSGGEVGVGRWCCSGNLEGTAGDCAPAQYTMNPDGSAWMMSKQYPGKHVLVPRNRILWMSPPDKAAMQFEAHLCIRPRSVAPAQVDPDDPNPEFTIVCASIQPGGV